MHADVEVFIDRAQLRVAEPSGTGEVFEKGRFEPSLVTVQHKARIELAPRVQGTVNRSQQRGAQLGVGISRISSAQPQILLSQRVDVDLREVGSPPQ